MFKRVMVSVVGVPLLILILSAAPDWAAALLIAAMCAVGAWELMGAVRAWPRARRSAAACAACVPLWIYLSEELLPLLLLALLFAMFLAVILEYEKGSPVPFFHLAAAVFAAMVFPLLLSCLLRLRLLPGGGALVFVPLCICFGGDTLALFAGMLFGKRKMAPKVSPKKTIAGAIGGLLGGAAGLAILKGVLALLQSLGWYESPPRIGWLTVIVLGLAGGLIGVLGDLSFSVVKREFQVKDYGNLLPGHGGVLDRFDSVTFVAPLVWCVLSVFPGLR